MTTIPSLATRCVIALALAMSAVSAQAQNPNDSKPLRIIVITSPGGQADTVARMVAEGLTRSLKRPVLVENKAGAGGNIATEYVAQQPADGTVLLLTSNNHTINPTLFPKVNYDWQKSFEPVTQLTRGPTVIAGYPGVPAKDMNEMLALSRTAELSYGSTGVGSAAHLAMELYRKETGFRVVHVPYKGAGPAVSDALGGQVQLVAVSLTSAIAHIKAGKLTGLAVTTERRWPGAPEIPTLKELGCASCVYETYIGLFAPKGTSAAYIRTLNEQMTVVMNEPANKAKLSGLGVEAVMSSPDEFNVMLKADFDKAAQVIRETRMTAE
jgi:tripartite-type tricarboxylate transporter receptor subunit TctC